MYDRTVWVDESDQYENRYKVTDNGDNTQTIQKVRGDVYVTGTDQDADNFNKMEDAITDAHIAHAIVHQVFRAHEWQNEADKAESDGRLDDLEEDTSGIHTTLDGIGDRLDDTDADIAQLIRAHNTEIKTVEITNTQDFPFNNSGYTVPLGLTRDNVNYAVIVIGTGAYSIDPDNESNLWHGNVGEVVISNRQVNGFRVSYTGSARVATITMLIIGGFNAAIT